MHPCIVSTGGGTPLREQNQVVMGSSGKVIYLEASFDILWGRLKGCKKRPLLQSGDPKSKIQTLIKERDATYKKVADFSVRVTSESPVKTAKAIYQLVQTQGES